MMKVDFTNSIAINHQKAVAAGCKKFKYKNLNTLDSLSVCSHDTVSMIAKIYGEKLHNYFFASLQSHADADDFVQDLYGRLLCYRHPIRSKSLSAFLHTIALNLIRDRLRRLCSHQATDTVSITDAEDIALEVMDPGRIVDGIEELARFDIALTHMQLDCRKAFYLHRLQGLSHKEIALSMGVSVSMVEKHIMRASTKLRRLMNM